MLRCARGQPSFESGCQAAFLCDAYGGRLVSAVVRFDELSRTWSELQTRLGVPLPALRWLNRSYHPSWREWLSRSAMRLTESLYDRDFELYEAADRQVAHE
jgi:hypothetical protein